MQAWVDAMLAASLLAAAIAAPLDAVGSATVGFAVLRSQLMAV
jgi:hypothetical protein